MIKDCFNCKYGDYKLSEEPCSSCLSLKAKESYSKFEPVEMEEDNNENTNQDTV